MSSSRSRNFRRRADDGDDEENEPKEPSNLSTTLTTNSTSKSLSKRSSIPSNTKPKKPQNQAPKLLSFVDDEDNETPSRSSSSSKTQKPSSRPNKPSSSHKITALKDRIAHSSSSYSTGTSFVPSNVQPQAGVYTKEALLELQKNTRTLASSRPVSESKPSSEPIVVLKGLVKPSENISHDLGEDEILESGFEGEDSTEKKVGLFRRDKDDTEIKFASMGIGKGRDSSGSLIPDQATINEIRAKRERLRKSRAAAPDYISLDGGSNHGAAEGLSDEEPEFQGRIAMFGEKLEGVKKGVFEVVDERGSDEVLFKENEGDDEDEEEKIWEEEQFRKGLGKRMDDGSTRAVSDSVPVALSVQQQKFVYPATSGYNLEPNVPAATSIGGAIGASQCLDVMSISQQAEVAGKALQENIRRLKVPICCCHCNLDMYSDFMNMEGSFVFGMF